MDSRGPELTAQTTKAQMGKACFSIPHSFSSLDIETAMRRGKNVFQTRMLNVL